MIGDSLILKFLKREGVPLQAIYCPGFPECGPEGGLDPYDFLCVITGHGCQVCGKGTPRSVLWLNLLRICNPCWLTAIINVSRCTSTMTELMLIRTQSQAARLKLQQAGFANTDRVERLLECIVSYSGGREPIQSHISISQPLMRSSTNTESLK